MWTHFFSLGSIKWNSARQNNVSLKTWAAFLQEDMYNKDNSRREWKQQQKWKPEKMYNLQNVFNVHFFYIPSGRKAVDINSRKNYQKGKSGHFVDLIYILRSLYSIILLNYSVVNHQTFLEIRYALEIQLWRQCRRKIRGLKHLKFKKNC